MFINYFKKSARKEANQTVNRAALANISPTFL